MAGPSITSGIYSLLKQNKQPTLDDITNDPLYQLEIQAIQSQYSDYGQQQSQNLANKLAAAAGKYAYTGPSLDLLKNFGNANQMLIQSAYNRSQDYVNAQREPTTGLYNAEQMRTGAAYENALRDIAGAQQNAATATTQSGALSPGVDPAYAQAQVAKQADIMNKIQQQTSQGKEFSLGQLKSAGTEQQNILGQFVGGLGTEASQKRQQAQAQVDQLIAKAQAQMNLAQAQQNAAQQQIRMEAAQSGQSYAGREKAAEIRALESSIKRAQSQADKAGSEHLSGIQGVLAMGMRAGRPDLAEKYLGMVASARRQASDINAQNAVKRQQGITGLSNTTPAAELQKLLDQAGGGPHPDIADKNLNPRDQTLIDAMNREPGLKFLQKYIIQTPDQARQQNQYFTAFGRTKQDYDKAIADAEWKKKHTIPGLGTDWNPVQNFVNQMNTRFTPFLNLDKLRANKSDFDKYNNYFKGLQDQADFLGLLDEIMGGKYGSGG